MKQIYQYVQSRKHDHDKQNNSALIHFHNELRHKRAETINEEDHNEMFKITLH